MQVHFERKINVPLQIGVTQLRKIVALIERVQNPNDHYMFFRVSYGSGQSIRSSHAPDLTTLPNTSSDPIVRIHIASSVLDITFNCLNEDIPRPAADYEIHSSESEAYEIKRGLDLILDESRNEIGWLRWLVIHPISVSGLAGAVAFLSFFTAVGMIDSALLLWLRYRMPPYPLVVVPVLFLLPMVYLLRKSIRRRLAVPVEVVIGSGEERARRRRETTSLVRPLLVLVTIVLGLLVAFLAAHLPGFRL